MPGAEDEKDLVVVRVLRLDGAVDGGRAVDVLLIPEAVNEHDGNFQGLRSENLIHGLLAPPRVVGRGLKNLAPEADLLKPATPPEFARRAAPHEHVAVVEGRPP